MNTLSTKARYGLGLLLSISTLLFCAVSSATSRVAGGNAAVTLLAFVAMAVMCFCAEQFDGGIPRFYEDLHRRN